MKHIGSCHWGAIKFEFAGPEIVDGVRCNCSLCERKGILMATFTVSADEIAITSEQDVLQKYQFGTCKARHYFCSNCGIYTFHTLMSKPDQYRVNLGCIEGTHSYNLPFTIVDGTTI